MSESEYSCKMLKEHVLKTKPLATGAQGSVYLLGHDKVVKNTDEEINQRVWNIASSAGIAPYVYGVFNCGNERMLDNYIVMKKLNKKFNVKEKGQLEQLPELLTRAIESGIFHNDLHDENFMVDESGKVYAIDFDLAQIFSENGYIYFDRRLPSNKRIELQDGHLLHIEFTPEQLERIQRMRPDVPETGGEIKRKKEEKEMLERRRQEVARKTEEETKKALEKILKGRARRKTRKLSRRLRRLK